MSLQNFHPGQLIIVIKDNPAQGVCPIAAHAKKHFNITDSSVLVNVDGEKQIIEKRFFQGIEVIINDTADSDEIYILETLTSRKHCHLENSAALSLNLISEWVRDNVLKNVR